MHEVMFKKIMKFKTIKLVGNQELIGFEIFEDLYFMINEKLHVVIKEEKRVINNHIIRSY
jgi:hypothetical protein